MKFNIFDSKGPLAKTINIVFDVFALSICWFLCSILVLTTGLASTGLYYAIDRYVLDNDENCLKGFVKSIKMNLKQGIIVYLIVFIIGVLIAWSMWVSYQMMAIGDAMGRVVFFFGIVISILYIGYVSYLFPTLASYQYKTKELFSTCFKLAIMHLPTTIMFSLLLIAVAVLAYYFWITLFFMPAIVAIYQRFFLKRIYKKHTKVAN